MSALGDGPGHAMRGTLREALESQGVDLDEFLDTPVADLPPEEYSGRVEIADNIRTGGRDLSIVMTHHATRKQLIEAPGPYHRFMRWFVGVMEKGADWRQILAPGVVGPGELSDVELALKIRERLDYLQAEYTRLLVKSGEALPALPPASDG